MQRQKIAYQQKYLSTGMVKKMVCGLVPLVEAAISCAHESTIVLHTSNWPDYHTKDCTKVSRNIFLQTSKNAAKSLSK